MFLVNPVANNWLNIAKQFLEEEVTKRDKPFSQIQA